MQSLIDFFSSANLSPHGLCLFWRPGLLRLHIISDGLIGFSYFLISLALVVFVRWRPDLVVGWIFWLFAIFIFACGLTHWLAIWTVWHPDYALEGLVKALTAAASVITAIAVLPLLPRLVAAPSLAQMAALNTALQAENRDRISLEAKLTTLNLELEARVAARTADLLSLNQALQKSEERFRDLIEAAPTAMLMVDPAGRIAMVNKHAERIFGCSRAELIGEPVETLLPAPLRASHRVLRSEYLDAPESRPMGVGRDLHALRKDGTTFPVEIGLNPVETEEGTMVLSAIVDISDHKNKEARISAALKEKDVLLAEIHHRVKNNLQIIHSLLDLQSARVSDPIALEMLRESQNRIGSMAIIHQTLYGSSDFGQVDFGKVVERLTPQLTESYGIRDQRISISIDAASVFLPLNLAIPTGLIANEIISNALKHAFPGNRTGIISISLMEAPPGQFILSISDNGVGLPDDLDFNTTPSLGLKLVSLLTEQLGGAITIERGNPTRFAVTFSMQRAPGRMRKDDPLPA